jgi:hypothetical protein
MKLVMYRILSIILLPIGFVFILNSKVSITGHTIAEPVTEIYTAGFITGFFLIAIAGFFLIYVYLKLDRKEKEKEKLRFY